MLPVAVNVSVAGNHDNVDQCPDSAAPEGQEHYDSGCGVSGVESMDTEASKHDAKYQCDQPPVLLLLGGLAVAVSLAVFRLWLKRFTAVRTKSGVWLYRRSAVWAIVHF